VDKFDRIFQLHAILSSRRTPIPLEELMAKLECSKSTLHRAINSLKDHLNAPVVFDADVPHRAALREIVERHGAVRPRIFGSAVSGEDTDSSDLYLLVDPTSRTTLLTLAAIQLEAERLLGVPVDVLTPKSLLLRYREQVLREAQPV
jgi:predicted nucleotidyltransferase